MEKVSVATVEHYSWGKGCDGWHLVRQPSLAVISERMPARTSEVLHLHFHACQFFYVTSGTAVIEVEGTAVTLMAGEGLEIPPGTPHQTANPGPGDLTFLLISQPHHHGDREVLVARPAPGTSV